MHCCLDVLRRTYGYVALLSESDNSKSMNLSLFDIIENLFDATLDCLWKGRQRLNTL